MLLMFGMKICTISFHRRFPVGARGSCLDFRGRPTGLRSAVALAFALTTVGDCRMAALMYFKFGTESSMYNGDFTPQRNLIAAGPCPSTKGMFTTMLRCTIHSSSSLA